MRCYWWWLKKGQSEVVSATNQLSIDDRELFMKGIDYSYYYEQEDGAEVVEEKKND